MKEPSQGIRLGNDLTWAMAASGPRSAQLLRRLSHTACLVPLTDDPDRTLFLREPHAGIPLVSAPGGVTYELPDAGDAQTAIDMARVCSLLAAHTPRALLCHGALVERAGQCILLAGPGGRGKTTTANRLPSPWRVLADDASLIVPNPAGAYVAHPWPTWSRLILHQSPERWNVQGSLPLAHVFFLSWSEHDVVERVGRARALCLVLECVEQLRGYLPAGACSSALRLKDLDRASALVEAVPVSILHISPAGPFWLAIEAMLPPP